MNEKPTIYIDLDGTLLGDRASLLHDKNGERTTVGIDAIFKAERAGADLVIATGRDKYRASEFARSVGITRYIAELGCVIQTTEEEIIDLGNQASKFIEENSLTLPSFLGCISDAAHVLISKFANELELHAPFNRDRHGSLLMRGNVDVNIANEILAESGFEFLELIPNGHGMFRRTMPGVENVIIYHLTPIGVTKLSGIEYDQKLRGKSRENSFMIGDGMADAQCDSAVNTVFIPINGIASDPNVKTYADSKSNIHVLEKSHNEGFAEAVEIILNKY
jgi:hydroxymethylpyrimidine pyrophosphatase-like HAD family hydrolase